MSGDNAKAPKTAPGWVSIPEAEYARMRAVLQAVLDQHCGICEVCLAIIAVLTPSTVGSGPSAAAAQSPQDASGPAVAPAPKPRPQEGR